MQYSDIKLLTRTQAEELINAKEETAVTTYEGWGSKFQTQEGKSVDPSTEDKTYYPDSSYLGFNDFTVKKINTDELGAMASTTQDTVYTPATNHYYSKVTVAKFVPTLQNIVIDQAKWEAGTEITCSEGYDGIGKITFSKA